LKSDIFPLHF